MTRLHSAGAILALSAAGLLLAGQIGVAQTGSAAASIRTWLEGYDAAFNAKDLAKLGTFYHSEVTIFEGGGIDRGWVSYRDHHLGPELKAFEELQFSRTNVQVQMMNERAAYVTAEYSLKAKVKLRQIDANGLETLVVIRMDDGTWKIRHSHTSSRRQPAPPGQ